MKKIFSVFARSKESLGLIWTLIIILLVTLVTVSDNKRAANFSATCYQCEPIIIQPVTVNTYDLVEKASAAKATHWQSFGDNFSSLAYLDSSQTDMFLDDTVTALVFPPLYSWIKRFDCQNMNCFSASNFIEPVPILAADFDFKEKTVKQLDLLPRPLPPELINREIISVNINKLGWRQVVSFVVKEGLEERGLVYFLEANNYVPLVTFENGVEILTRWGFGGGRIVAGGDDNDFLIAYLGYEAKVWHYKAGALSDVSRFFGLRVAGAGFYPYIIKQGTGKDSVWYVLSLTAEKVKLIKLWQNDTDDIQGAVDLSALIINKLASSGTRLMAIRPGSERGIVDFIFENSFGEFSLWSFKDRGFDNSRDRSVVSKNINSSNRLVLKAFIKSIGISAYGQMSGYEINFPSTNFKIYLGDESAKMFVVNPGQVIQFSGANRELFWKIDFLALENQEHSPWFDHLNDLQYLVVSDINL